MSALIVMTLSSVLGSASWFFIKWLLERGRDE